MAEAVSEKTGGKIDAIVAVAGVSTMSPLALKVNYFGMVQTLELLRPLLAESDAPRAVAVSSMASFQPVDDQIVEARLNQDEEAGLAIAQSRDEHGQQHMNPTPKKASNRWMRPAPPTPEG